MVFVPFQQPASAASIISKEFLKIIVSLHFFIPHLLIYSNPNLLATFLVAAVLSSVDVTNAGFLFPSSGGTFPALLLFSPTRGWTSLSVLLRHPSPVGGRGGGRKGGVGWVGYESHSQAFSMTATSTSSTRHMYHINTLLLDQSALIYHIYIPADLAILLLLQIVGKDNQTDETYR